MDKYCFIEPVCVLKTATPTARDWPGAAAVSQRKPRRNFKKPLFNGLPHGAIDTVFENDLMTLCN